MAQKRNIGFMQILTNINGNKDYASDAVYNANQRKENRILLRRGLIIYNNRVLSRKNKQT